MKISPVVQAAGVILSGVLTIVASFVPWATVRAPLIGEVSISGIGVNGAGRLAHGASSVEGYPTLVLGAAILLVGIVSIIRARTPPMITILLGAITAAVGITLMLLINQITEIVARISGGGPLSDLFGASVGVSMGMGPYLITFGGVIAIVAGAAAWYQAAAPHRQPKR